MNSKILLITSLGCGLLLLVLLIVFIDDEEESDPPAQETVSTPRPVTPPPAEEEPPAAPPAPEVEEVEPEPAPPAPEVVQEEELLPPVPVPVALPDLNESDSFVQAEINDLDNANAILRQLVRDQIIRKSAVLIDGMSRGDVPARDLPVSRPQQDMAVTEQGEGVYRLDPASYSRFNLLVNTFTAIDSETAAEKIQLMFPLFESAFTELGYPDRTFAATLQAAIDNVLDARVPGRELLLTRPSVNYRFADPRLENLTELEKLLIRMGPENTTRVQQKVREINALLAD